MSAPPTGLVTILTWSGDRLHAGDTALATLRATRAGAVARWAERSWRLEASGNDVVATEHDGFAERGGAAARLSRSRWTGSGVVTLADGTAFVWRRSGILGGAWQLNGPSGAPLLRMAAWRRDGRTELFGAGLDDPRVRLLVLVARFAQVWSSRDDSTAAIAATLGVAGS